MDRINEILRDARRARTSITIGGYSMLDSVVTPNAGAVFVTLDPWGERTERRAPGRRRCSARHCGAAAQQIQEAIAFAFNPPPIQGLGTAGGFEYQLQDLGGAGYHAADRRRSRTTSSSRATPTRC